MSNLRINLFSDATNEHVLEIPLTAEQAETLLKFVGDFEPGFESEVRCSVFLGVAGV